MLAVSLLCCFHMMVMEMLDAEAGVYTIGSDRAERGEHRQMRRQSAVRISVPLASCVTLGRSFSLSRSHYPPFPGGKKRIFSNSLNISTSLIYKEPYSVADTQHMFNN